MLDPTMLRVVLPRGNFRILDCLGLNFARFHGGERESRVVKRKSIARV